MDSGVVFFLNKVDFGSQSYLKKDNTDKNKEAK